MYREDKTKELDQLVDQRKQENDLNTREIKDLQKQLQDADEFNGSKDTFLQKIKQLEYDIEQEKKDKQFELGEKERDKI